MVQKEFQILGLTGCLGWIRLHAGQGYLSIITFFVRNQIKKVGKQKNYNNECGPAV